VKLEEEKSEKAKNFFCMMQLTQINHLETFLKEPV